MQIQLNAKLKMIRNNFVQALDHCSTPSGLGLKFYSLR
jgi:hypothetical protein